MSNSHLQFALILIRARQSNTSPQSINLCRRLLCFVGATLRLRLCSWLWVFLSVSSVHWRLVLRTRSWLTPVTGYQLSAFSRRMNKDSGDLVWTLVCPRWCRWSGSCQLWRQRRLLERAGAGARLLRKSCVAWLLLLPLSTGRHCTALLHCHSTPGHYCTTRNLQSALQMSTSLLRLVLMMFLSQFTSSFLRCSCI